MMQAVFVICSYERGVHFKGLTLVSFCLLMSAALQGKIRGYGMATWECFRQPPTSPAVRTLRWWDAADGFFACYMIGLHARTCSLVTCFSMLRMLLLSYVPGCGCCCALSLSQNMRDVLLLLSGCNHPVL
jgi:hypothetical protein